ncbi:hypothetical protein B0H13DRAFT_1867020 [Mycena leptocephala]|nr:hypothetical protein B0H13DRAFT_1867020 [Mycena leptocephala]
MWSGRANTIRSSAELSGGVGDEVGGEGTPQEAICITICNGRPKISIFGVRFINTFINALFINRFYKPGPTASHLNVDKYLQICEFFHQDPYSDLWHTMGTGNRIRGGGAAPNTHIEPEPDEEEIVACGRLHGWNQLVQDQTQPPKSREIDRKSHGLVPRVSASGKASLGNFPVPPVTSRLPNKGVLIVNKDDHGSLSTNHVGIEEDFTNLTFEKVKHVGKSLGKASASLSKLREPY